VPPWTAAIINFLPGHPAQSLAVGFFFVFGLFPGGSYILGLLMVIPMSIAISYSWGLLTTMLPRSGGDYVFVSRVMHPLLGMLSSACQLVANVLSNAFFGTAVVTIGLGPGLTMLGLIGHNPGLVQLGTTIAGSKLWIFVIGSVMMLLPVIALLGNWGLMGRLINIAFFLVSGGLVLAVLIALFTSNETFAANFNHFAAPYTGKADTYGSIIQAAHSGGIVLHPAFSFANTIPIAGLFATFSIYSYFAAFVGGELRRGNSIKTAHNMALTGIVAILLSGTFAAIFFRSYGEPFMIAANSTGMPASIPMSPTYFTLSSVSTGNFALAAVILICYLCFWPLISYLAFLQPTRMFFAWGFDNVLPKAVTRVSANGSPWVALIITYVLSLITFAWGLTSAGFLQILTYAVLIQLISMALVGIAAVLVPYRRPQLYRASATTKTFAGIPVVVIAGAGSVISCVIIWVMYFHYPAFGFADTGKFLSLLAGVLIAVSAYYLVVRAVRARQGLDLRRVYAEIPPE
jgi:amino acid transporter